MTTVPIWIKYNKGRPTEIDFQGGNVNKLKKKIQNELHNKLGNFDIDEITLRVTEKELREDMTIGENFTTSYDEPIYVEVTNTGKRKSTESNGFNKKQKFDPLFENICNLVRNQKQKLCAIQDQQDNTIIQHDEDLAVLEKSVLYVRKSYKYLYNKLEKKSADGLKRFLITGTSGIGKSCFLIYVLIQLLCDDVTVIFQPLNDKYFYCFKNLTVTRGTYDDFLSLLGSPTTWYLADGAISPKLVQATTVVSLSPNGIATKDFQEFEKRHPVEYYMGPWTLEELLSCRKHVFPLVPKEIVTNLFHKAGGVPRYVLQNVEVSIRNVIGNNIGHEGRPDAKEMEIVEKEACKRIELAISETDDFDKIIKCFTENEGTYVEISNRIVHRIPDETHCDYHYEWASAYVFDRIQERLEEKAWVDCLHKIRIMRNPYEASARGFLFECYAIHLFRTGNQKFEVRKLRGEEKDQFSIHRKPNAGFVRNLSDLLKYSGENIVIVPDKQNFGAVDLFVTPNCIFQVTVSEHHPIKQVELTKVITSMPVYISDQNAKIQLYFVVPDDIYDKFEHQIYTTRDKDSNEDRKVLRIDSAIKNVEQWALKVQINPILEE
uniref:Crinkler family protein n=1 Tax=Rhizophagus irregularis (strain DAOM 181602 / DAOM 197198 / MUCL 43194) TaxID=747089 RepID=U9T1W8_RHIID